MLLFSQKTNQETVLVLNISGKTYHISKISLQKIINSISNHIIGLSDFGLLEKSTPSSVLIYLAALQNEQKIIVCNPLNPPEKINNLAQKYGISFYTAVDILSEGALKQCIETSLQNETSQQLAVNLFKPTTRTYTLTSGSTGDAKLVVHRIQHHLNSAQKSTKILNFTAQAKLYMTLPIFHVSGQAIIFRWLYTECTLYIDDLMNFATLAQVSHTSLVGSQLTEYLIYLENNTIPKLDQVILLGGSYIDKKLCMQAACFGIKCYVGYGMTETASAICIGYFAKMELGIEPLPGNTIKVINQQIFLKTNSLADGYLVNDVVQPFVLQDGYYNSSDLGSINNGKLVVLGRRDNGFISGGENIFPEEIEKAILATGLVKEVIVVAKNDTTFLHRPFAYIDAASFALAKHQEINTLLKDTLEKFKYPIGYLPLQKSYLNGGIKYSRQFLQNLINK